MVDKNSYVYILTNQNNTVLYTGVTSNLCQRIFQHKNGTLSGFAQKYKCTKLIYYEVFLTIEEAIAREKQIKGGSRQKKMNLILSKNSKWADLYPEICG